MLTTHQLYVPREAPPAVGYFCDAIAYTPEDGHAFRLGSHHARSSRLAMRWLRHRARHIADQLDAPAARPARHWTEDQAECERALSTLATGDIYTFTISDDTTRYVLSARPTGAAR